MCFYALSGYDKQVWRCNPIRVFEFLLCIICLSLAVVLLVDGFVHPVTLVVAVSVSIMYFFITLLDMVATGFRRPIFWTAWISFAALAFLLFVAGAICIMLDIGHVYSSVVLIVAGVFFIVSAIVFLIDALVIVYMLKSNTTVYPNEDPYGRGIGQMQNRRRKDSTEMDCCWCCLSTSNRPLHYDKAIQYPTDYCTLQAVQAAPCGDIEYYPQPQQYVYDNCRNDIVCEQPPQLCECHGVYSDLCPTVRQLSYTVVPPAPVVVTSPCTSATGMVTTERIYPEVCTEKYVRSYEPSPLPQRITSRDASICTVTTYGGTFPVGNKDEPPLPAPARIGYRNCQKSPRLSTVLVQPGKSCSTQSPSRKPCSAITTCSDVVSQCQGTTPPSSSICRSELVSCEEPSVCVTSPQQTCYTPSCESPRQSLQVQQRSCKSAEVQVETSRSHWCGRQHVHGHNPAVPLVYVQSAQPTSPTCQSLVSSSYPSKCQYNQACQRPLLPGQQPLRSCLQQQPGALSPRCSQQPPTSTGASQTLQPINEVPQKPPTGNNEVQTSETINSQQSTMSPPNSCCKASANRKKHSA